MPNEENNKLERVITKLKQLTKSIKDSVVDYARSPVERVSNVFTRENVVNAVMPKILARGVNKVFDMIGDIRRKKYDNGRDAKNAETSTNAESVEELDVDLLEELIDTMDSGFDETNKNLTHILMKIGGAPSSSYQRGSSSLLLGHSNKTEDSTAEILETEYEILDIAKDTNQALTDLLAINSTVVKTLQTIEKNTRVDSLKQREDELETRKHHAFQRLVESGSGKGKNDAGGLMNGLLNNILGFAGLKSVTGMFGGKLLGGIKGAVGSAWQGAKSAGSALLSSGGKAVQGAVKGMAAIAPGPLKALGLLGAGAMASATPASALPAPMAPNTAKVEGAIAPSATKGGLLQSIKGAGGKLLGAPLAVGVGAYEAYNVGQDANLSSGQKTTEYSKIGGKTVGALAGAKAGAAVGAIGGPIGSAIGGVVGGIGGYFLGEKGGEIVGDIINAVSPSSKNAAIDAEVSKEILADNLSVTGINSKLTKNANLAATPSVVGVSDIVNPEIGALTPGQTRTNTLQSLTQQIEQTNAEKQEMKASPTIVPITISNQNSAVNSNGSQDGSQRQRNSVPVVRNQDGTIQRLLDLNYSPLLVS